MKLGCKQVAVFHRAYEIIAIMAVCAYPFGLFEVNVIRVHKIKVAIGGNTRKQPAAGLRLDLIPTHMRHNVHSRQFKARYPPGYQVQTLVQPIFLACFTKQLHSQADAQQRNLPGHHLFNRISQPFAG